MPTSIEYVSLQQEYPIALENKKTAKSTANDWYYSPLHPVVEKSAAFKEHREHISA